MFLHGSGKVDFYTTCNAPVLIPSQREKLYSMYGCTMECDTISFAISIYYVKHFFLSKVKHFLSTSHREF